MANILENDMCPQGLALHYLAAGQLLEYATRVCPINARQPWAMEEIETAVACGPHVSVLVPEAIKKIAHKIEDKVA